MRGIGTWLRRALRLLAALLLLRVLLGLAQAAWRLSHEPVLLGSQLIAGLLLMLLLAIALALMVLGLRPRPPRAPPARL